MVILLLEKQDSEWVVNLLLEKQVSGNSLKGRDNFFVKFRPFRAFVIHSICFIDGLHPSLRYFALSGLILAESLGLEQTQIIFTTEDAEGREFIGGRVGCRFFLCGFAGD